MRKVCQDRPQTPLAQSAGIPTKLPFASALADMGLHGGQPFIKTGASKP